MCVYIVISLALPIPCQAFCKFSAFSIVYNFQVRIQYRKCEHIVSTDTIIHIKYNAYIPGRFDISILYSIHLSIYSIYIQTYYHIKWHHWHVYTTHRHRTIVSVSFISRRVHFIYLWINQPNGAYNYFKWSAQTYYTTTQSRKTNITIWLIFDGNPHRFSHRERKKNENKNNPKKYAYIMCVHNRFVFQKNWLCARVTGCLWLCDFKRVISAQMWLNGK